MKTKPEAAPDFRARAVVSGEIDFLYLFLCTLQWRKGYNEEAGWVVLAALTSSDPATRAVAHVLLNGC